MTDDERTYRKAWMSDGQWLAACLLADVYRGFHHIRDGRQIKPFGYGIEMSVSSDLATFDFDLLTRLVVLAHDRCIRLEIGSSGPALVRLMLHARKGREGSMFERHPTMEDAINSIRTVAP